MTYKKGLGLLPPAPQAPYHTHPDAVQGSYIVRLQANYTLSAHFKFMLFEPEHTPLDDGTAYFAFLHAGGLKDIREDPGVASVEDNTPATGLGREYRAPYHTHGDCAVPGEYEVLLRPGHDLEKHFEFVGRRFEVEVAPEDPDIYDAKLDDALLALVRSDPGVELVVQNAYWELT